MWMLNFIPDGWIYYAVLAVLGSGVVLYALSFLVGIFPPFRPYREPARILGTLLAILGVYFYGGYDAEKSNLERIAELQKQVAVSEAKSKDANVQIVTKYVEKTKVIHDTQIVIQHDIDDVKDKIDATCKVDPSAIAILNKAAKDLK